MTVANDCKTLGEPARLLCTIAGNQDIGEQTPFDLLPAIGQRTWHHVGDAMCRRGELRADGAFTDEGLRALTRQQEINLDLLRWRARRERV